MKNTFAGYDSRINVGPGLGYEFIKTERHYLKGLASVLYTYKNFSPPENRTDTYMSGRATGEHKGQTLDNLAFKQLGEYQVSFEDTGVYFVISETGLEAKVTDIVSVEFGYIVWYQGDPPADKDSMDTKFLTTLNFSYDLW